MSCITVRDGRIAGPRGTVLEGIDIELPSNAVTAIMGPSGGGKSALLRALSGEPAAPGWRFEGTWCRGGETMGHEAGGRTDVAWLPQESYRVHHPHESFSRPPAVSCWEDAFAAGADLVLLDEPLRGVASPQPAALVRSAKRHVERGHVVLITHDLQIGRAIADHVCFVCAGRIIDVTSAARFFDDHPLSLVRQFVQQGNCWPTEARAPALPSHFRWILPGKLAGMGKPGLSSDVDEDLAAISEAGVTLLVSLTMDPFPNEMLKAHGLASRHLAIRDMGVPALGPVASLCGQINRTISAGGAVAIHCHAGIGRTGTLLASFLCWLGRTPDEAIDEIRREQASYIQTAGQVAFVREFAERYGRA